MNIALVVAGGVGSRMGQDVPKQFLTVYDVPVIIYTLKNIESTGLFDRIFVVCSKGWEDFIASYSKQYEVKTFAGTIPCGDTRFQSIFNGILELMRILNDDVNVAVVDGNRPLIPHAVFEQTVQTINEKKCDCVIPLEPCHDSMYLLDGQYNLFSTNREILFKGQAPEIARLKTIYEVFCRANEEKIYNEPLVALMLKYGKKVLSVPGSSRSMKITTVEDFLIFKALIEEQRITQLK